MFGKEEGGRGRRVNAVNLGFIDLGAFWVSGDDVMLTSLALIQEATRLVTRDFSANPREQNPPSLIKKFLS